MKNTKPFLSHLLALVFLFLLSFLPVIQSCGTPPQMRFVNFEVDEDVLVGKTAREQQDQLRDWLLLTALADAGLGADKITNASYDLPPVRHDYLRPVTSFEYGETRSRQLSDGRVVALLPANKAAEVRSDYLARIADEHRKNTGEIPTSLLVATYDLNLDSLTAKLSPFNTVMGKDLYSEKNYVQATVKNLSELAQFLKRIDDLTYAEMKNGQLLVGGRKVPKYPARPMRVEDIAALWQSEQSIRDRLAAAEAPSQDAVAKFKARWQQKYDEYTAEWGTIHYTTATDLAEKERKRDAVLRQLQQQEEQEWSQLNVQLERQGQQAQEKLTKEKFASHSGFSLDPHYEYQLLKDELPNIVAKLKASPGVQQQAVDRAAQQARQGLDNHDSTAFYDLVDDYDQKVAQPDGTKSLHDRLTEPPYAYQQARYIGSLHATEVGMVLFYTDLLAKLWSFDYYKSTTTIDVPGAKSLVNAVPGFTPGTQVRVAPIYEAQMNLLTGARLWFGHNDKGFQIQENSLLFARNAARIFAKSYAGVEGNLDTEVAPRADTEVFINWWNDHYEEIGQYEPEYLRLNQIIKWTLLISWLSEANKSEALGFLNSDAVKVDHTIWFPDWVRKPEQAQRLKFNQWEKVGFINPNTPAMADATERAEAMLLLTSAPFEQFCKRYYLSGGVSLPGRQVFAKRANLSSLPKMTDKALLRSEIKLETMKSGEHVTQDGVTRKFGDLSSGKGEVRVTPPDNRPPHSIASQTAASNAYKLELTATPASRDLKAAASVGERRLGEFTLRRTANGYGARWQGQELQQAEAVAQRISRTPDMAGSVLAREPNVVQAYELPNRQFLVQMRASGKWLRFEAESTATTETLVQNQMLVADPQLGRRGVLVAEMSEGEVNSKFLESGLIRLQAGEPRIIGKLNASEPTLPTKPLEIEVETDTGRVMLSGKVEPQTGDVYLKGLSGDNKSVRNLRPDTLRQAADLGRTQERVHLQQQGRPLTTEDFAPIRKLTDEGKYDEAIGQIDALAKRQGNTPELKILKSSLQLRQGYAEDAVKLANTVVKESPDIGSLYGQISELQGKNWLPRSREDVGNLLKSFFLRDRLAAGPLKKPEVLPYLENKRLHIEVRGVLRDLFPQSRKITNLSEIDRARADIYLPDKPSFKPDVTVEEALQQAISNPARYDIFELPVVGLEDARPHRLVDTGSNVNYRPPGGGIPSPETNSARGRWFDVSPQTRPVPRFISPNPSPPPTPTPVPLGNDCDQKPRKIYLIVEK